MESSEKLLPMARIFIESFESFPSNVVGISTSGCVTVVVSVAVVVSVVVSVSVAFVVSVDVVVSVSEDFGVVASVSGSFVVVVSSFFASPHAARARTLTIMAAAISRVITFFIDCAFLKKQSHLSRFYIMILS